MIVRREILKRLELRSVNFQFARDKRATDLTSMNHEVVCAGDREIFVTIIEGSLEFDLILLQL